MIVRIVVRLKDSGAVRHLVHSTPFEPVFVSPEEGIVAFDVPYRRVEAVLSRVAQSGVGAFLAHLRRTSTDAEEILSSPT
jgi:hypothetical protein